MVNASAKQAITSELRALRRQSGPLDTAKLTSARAILRGLGGDDPEIALTRLTDLAAEHGDDREVEAAMASLGWGATSETSLDRLAEFSERHYVDPRTVRRWSDEGIRKLTLLILGSAPWIQPRIRQTLDQDVDTLRLGIHIAIPAGLRMFAPQFWVGDREIEIRMPEFQVKPVQQDLKTGLQPFATLDELPLELRLEWRGEKYPIYESVTHGTQDVIFKSRIVFLDMRTTISKHTADLI